MASSTASGPPSEPQGAQEAAPGRGLLDSHRTVTATPSRLPAIPVADHAPAQPMSQPKRADMARRAASPAKPRTQRLPMERERELAATPTLIDLCVDLKAMSKSALEGRAQVLEAELERVRSAISENTRRSAHLASRSPPRSFFHQESESNAVSSAQPSLDRRSRDRSSSSSAAAAPHPLSAELRSIALRVVTPPRARPTPSAHQPQGAAGARLGENYATAAARSAGVASVGTANDHPASQPPSPDDRAAAYLDQCLRVGGGGGGGGGGQFAAHDRMDAMPNYFAGGSGGFGATGTPGAVNLYASSPAALVQSPRAGLAQSGGAAGGGGGGVGRGHSSMNYNGMMGAGPQTGFHAAAPSPPAASPGAASGAGDFMYPAHHNALLDELAELRRQRLRGSTPPASSRGHA